MPATAVHCLVPATALLLCVSLQVTAASLANGQWCQLLPVLHLVLMTQLGLGRLGVQCPVTPCAL